MADHRSEKSGVNPGDAESSASGSSSPRKRPWWLPPFSIMRVAIIVALMSVPPALHFGVGTLQAQLELSRAEEAKAPAAEVLQNARLQLLDNGVPGSPVSAVLGAAHTDLTASLSHLQQLAAGAPQLRFELSGLGSLDTLAEYESRWWELRLTGRASEPPEVGDQLHDSFDPATARESIVELSEDLQVRLVAAIDSARGEVRSDVQMALRWATVAIAAAAVALILRWLRRIAHGQLPQVQLVSRFSRPPPAQIRATRRVAAWCGVAAAWILLGAGVGLATYFAAVHLKWSYWIFAVAAIAITFAGGLPLWRRSRRRLVPDARSFLQVDGRPPILYLREFGQDEPRGEFSGLVTQEEQMVRELAAVGPTLAVGRPNEQRTPIGAARVYLRDEDWQTVVTALLECSSAVVLGVGGSPGVRWELETAVALVAPERLLLLVAPGTDLDNLASTLPGGLPPDVTVALADARAERVVSFDRDWQPHVEKVVKQNSPQPYAAGGFSAALPVIALSLLRPAPSSIGSSPVLKRLYAQTAAIRHAARYPGPRTFALLASNVPLFVWSGFWGGAVFAGLYYLWKMFFPGINVF